MFTLTEETEEQEKRELKKTVERFILGSDGWLYEFLCFN